QVTKPIERAVSGVPGLDQLQSTSANSFAFVVAQFDYGADLDEAVATIEENIRTSNMPGGVEPTVAAFNFNAAPILIASVSAQGETDLEGAAKIARTELIPELLSLPGVATADLAGGLEDRLVVTLDPDRLAEAGVSSQQVVGILQANNLTLPGGELSVDGARIPVSTIGRFESVEQIRSLVVGVRASTPLPAASSPIVPASLAPSASAPRPITLGELGVVEVVSLATTGYGRTNGQPAVTISISKASTANTVSVAQAAQAKLDEIAARHPGEIEIATVSDQSVFILESSEGLVREGGLGAVFAVLTIFLFLFNLRSTFVAAVSIPLSILTALVVMQVAGITLNILTLGGLAVAVGRVVDDSIVVLENIYRHRALGDDRLTAVTKGPREVAGAITASTLTTVAVFLPLGFAGGFVSQFFLSFSLTITFALLASLIVALTVVPVLAYLLVGRVGGSVDETGEPRNSFWVRIYDPAIRFVLRNRWTKVGTVAVAAVLFFASIAIVPLLPTTFIDSGSEKIVQVSVSPPSGAGSEQVLERAAEAEVILLADPDVELVATSVPGDSDVGFQTVLAAQQGRATNSAQIVVRLDSAVDLDAKIQALSEKLGPVGEDGYEVTVGQQGGAGTNSLSVVVSAADQAIVAQTADAVRAGLEGEPGLANLTSDLVKAAPEVQVQVDPNRAIGVGLTAAQVGAEIRGALTSQTVGRVQLAEGDPVALVVRLDPAHLTSVESLRNLPVGTTAKVPLGTIATVDQADVQGRITRIDEAPSATITAEITSGDTGATSLAVQAVIDRLRADGTIPLIAEVRLGGVTAQQSEAFGGLFAAMGIAILLVYLAMVVAFNSMVTPFIILFSLPLATIGAFPALLLTGRPIGLSALIGFLMLIGIVVTNAIVLLDLVERLRADGHSTRDALIEGGRTRIRPILMTAIATMLALVPLAAGFNQGSIIAAELGTVVIGGLLSSTFLTLLVVPVVYALVDGLRSWLVGGRAPRPVRYAEMGEPAPGG
ncbi:MAG: efflux RND transporter permease subunit, partial [Candidatus Limnocylindrales bacterium]|nr:efflux RND transporter permease subunit [Candidatus Limnocylindrales bacterium]